MGTVLDAHAAAGALGGPSKAQLELAFSLDDPSFQSDHFRCVAAPAPRFRVELRGWRLALTPPAPLPPCLQDVW